MQHPPLIVACNNVGVLDNNLRRSADLVGGDVPVVVRSGFANASAAYNSGIAMTEAPWRIFLHQDVYLPPGWLASVAESLRQLEARDPNWAVVGVWGLGSDGRYAGRVWCTGGGKEHVGLTDGTCEVASIDEIVIILNGKHGLSFDEQLPGFHLYATDIALTAAERGLKSYVIQAPLVHNSRCNPQPLDKHYFAAYRYMQRKWRPRLPLQTAVVPVTATGWPLYKQWLKNELRQWRGKIVAKPPADDPKAIAIKLGYEGKLI